MTRTHWIRLGSLAAIVGGGSAALFAGLDLASAITQLIDRKSPLISAIFQVHLVTWGAPILVLFYVLTLIGLQARGARQAGAVGWVTITLALAGAVIVGLGSGLIVSVMYSQADICIAVTKCSFYDPNHYMSMGGLAMLFGAVIFAIGMILYGNVTIRQHILSRHSWLPFATGGIALLAATTLVVTPLFSESSDGASTLKFIAIYDTIALIFSLTWILLGFAMRARGDSDLPAQPVTVEPAV